MICRVSSISAAPAASGSDARAPLNPLRTPRGARLAFAVMPAVVCVIVMMLTPYTAWTPVLAVAGGWLGALVGLALRTVWIVVFGPRCGVQAVSTRIGVGPHWRFRVHDDRFTDVRKAPLPLYTVLMIALRPVPNWAARLRWWAFSLLVVQLAAGAAALQIGGAFCRTAGASLTGSALVLLLLPPAGPLLRRPPSAEELDRAGLLARSPLQIASFRMVAGDTAAARGALDALPPAGPAAPGQALADAQVCLLEGRYTRAAAGFEEVLDQLSAAERYVARIGLARALAYGMECGDAPADAADRFPAMAREARNVPARVTAGVDVPALLHLVGGKSEDALAEARRAAHNVRTPQGRCLALCTLALAQHQAGQTRQARKTLARAQAMRSGVARVAFVHGVIEGTARLYG